MRTIAIEGRCFVVFACQYFTRTDGPLDYAPIQGDDPQTVLIRGGSCVVNPLGNALVEPDFSGECVKFAELDRRIVARGKFDLDVAGRYSHPDVFRLSVDTRPMMPVHFGHAPAWVTRD
jgi:nitrilase